MKRFYAKNTTTKAVDIKSCQLNSVNPKRQLKQLSTAELAEFFGLSISTIIELSAKGLIPSNRSSSNDELYFDPSAVLFVLNSWKKQGKLSISHEFRGHIKESEFKSTDSNVMLKFEDLVQLLKVSRRKLQSWRALGKLPKPDLHIGKVIRWNRKTISLWIENLSNINF